MKHLLLAGLIWGITFVATGAVGAQDTKPSVNAGIYTAAQAARGAEIFGTSCIACHEKARFTGDEFLKGWTGKPLHDLFLHMSTTMPEDDPGSLKPQQYADVVAYFLQLNGYPAGKTELASAAEGLKTIMFDKPAKK